MSKPTRIQLSRKKDWRMPPNTKVVSRPSKFGNPYNWQDFLTPSSGPRKAKATVTRFFLWSVIQIQEGRQPTDFIEWFRWIAEHLHEIRDADHVACWCKLTEICHGDVLIELANKERP